MKKAGRTTPYLDPGIPIYRSFDPIKTINAREV